MNLASQLRTLEEQGRGLARTERAMLCCGVAKQLEKAGEYEAAREALSEFWPERHRSPILDQLDREAAAQVLLRVGTLAGWLGSTHQAEGRQEMAKNLITQSIRTFEELGQSKRVAEAYADLALCYWREGSFDEARISLTTALDRLKEEDNDLKAVVLIRAGMTELRAGQLNQALRFYDDSAPLVQESSDASIKGAFHNQLANLYENLGTGEPNNDFTDRALIEYAAASFHFEEAGHRRYQACVDINLGFLFFTLGRFAEAHKHLNRARSALLEIDDQVHLAQVNDTRARTLIAEGRLTEAERIARSAIKTLEKGDEHALLAEALITRGTALARLGRSAHARALFERAIEVAETAGDFEGAARAQLSIIEEFAEQMTATKLVSIFHSAADRLQRSQDPAAAKRLISCARIVIDALGKMEAAGEEPNENIWESFSLKQQMILSERALIERALKDAGGAVTRAARLLGFRHHQSLISIINSRHKELLKSRSAVRKRRHHIIGKNRAKQIKKNAAGADQISILHVEDNKVVAKWVADILTPAGFRVDSCMSGKTALKILKGSEHYDLIIVDNDLPGLDGLELVRRTQSIAHRQRTPIIMLSGEDCEKEAWRAGVDAFLRKPEDVEQVSLTISRLLRTREEI